MGRRVGSTSTCFVLTFLSWFRGAAARYDSCTTGTITDIGNGRCDAALNVPSCGFDGGDCCPCTCSDGPDHSCSDNTFDCEYLDCDASGISSDFEWDDTPECEEDDDQTDRTGTFGPLGKTFSAREGEGTACCEKNYIADGYCDSVNNHIGCSWDGGDCCGCTCDLSLGSVCGSFGYTCVDPACFNSTLVAEFPDCDGRWMSIGDGECNAVNNNAACGYDGGDCCLCSCSGAACESNNFDCLDPNAGDETFDCSEPPTFPVCSPQTRRTWIVDNSAQAGVLADAVNCSGGSFEVEWRGNVTVHQPIYVVGGTVLTVSGADTGAVMDGDHQTRLFVVINGTLVVSNTDVFSGRGNAGGAIVAVRSVLTFNRTSFVRNGAENGNGGAMHISDGSSVSIVGGKFEYNSAHTRGGAVFVSDSSMVSYNTAWINNYSAFDGGAAYVTTNSNVSLSAAEFVDNFGSGSGGAIFLHTGSLVTIGGGIFRSNFALSDGGAVGSSVLDSANNPANSGLVIRGVATFDGNSCGGNGGALALLGGISVDISTAGINFLHNMANVAGGAIFVSGIGVGPVFENASFVSNSAVIGGAVSIVASGTAATVADPSYSTTFDRCRFIDNRAERTGGAIDTAAGRDAFANSVFERNRASTGGALRLAGTTAAISNCSFVDNMSDDREGTAISNDGYFSTMEELYFSGNVFDCPETMYLGYIADGNPAEIVCDNCQTECENCVFEAPLLFPMCAEVFAHASSAGGNVTLETLSIDAGYWRSTQSSEYILACHNADACLGGVTGRAGYCLEGYEGPYCAVCSDGYTAELGFVCRACSTERAGAVALAVVLGVVALLAAVAGVTYMVSGGAASRGNRIVGRLTRYIPLHSVKIVVVAWQIVTQFTSVANVTYPELYERLLDLVYVVNLDLGWVLSAGCVLDVDFHDRLLISTIGPIVVLLILGGTFATAARIHRGATDILQSIWHKHVSMVLLLTFFVYSSVSSMVFAAFACEDLGEGKIYLRADYRIECDSPKHRAFQVYAGFMIVLYAVGIPAFYGILLFRDRNVLSEDPAGREDTPRVTATSDLWSPYKPSVFYYEVIECGRRILLTGVVVFIYPNTAAQIAVTLLISFVFVVVSEALAPYASRWDTWLSRIGHAVVFVSMYVALLLKVDVSEEGAQSQGVFEALLVVAHGCMVLVVVAEAMLISCSYGVEQREGVRFRRGRSLGWKVDVASGDGDSSSYDADDYP